jgi:formylglycine-generating enzyme required for sulfatase activity
MAGELELTPAALVRVRAIFEASSVLGQGNPKLSEHPMTRGECRQIRARAGGLYRGSPRCGAPNMVPIYDPEGGAPEAARVCIDQFEFPNLVCEYPVVHVKAREAALLCEALEKRLCDAHEWEAACAGALRPPETEYAWGKARRTMTWLHNSERTRAWAYGADSSMERCATGSRKTPGCLGGYVHCGSNTYPTGAFPDCVSRFGVYDQHGNVAEHMSLPLAPEQLGSRGGHGSTEMKGSWFVFAAKAAHEDDCRWRAKDWHPSRVMDPKSHSNYHLGFRCCKDLAGGLDTP